MMPPLPEPDAWLCWLAEEDGSTRTMIVDEDPDGLRFNDMGEPSPFQVTPLHSVEQMHAYARTYAATVADPLVEALEWYQEQARLSRLIHGGGDAGRHALANDGGTKAREALKAHREQQ